MQCPACQTPLDETAPVCANCGADTQFTVQVPDGVSYGPYTLEAIRQYAAEGRLLPTTVLVNSCGENFELTQADIIANPSPQPPPKSRRLEGILVGLGCLLIVVLPVIVVFLFPAFNTARQHTRKSVCKSNMQQLTTAVRMYAGDWDGLVPPQDNWREALGVASKTLRCASSGLKQQSYKLNSRLQGHRLENIQLSAEVPLLYEAGLECGVEEQLHEGVGQVGMVDGAVQMMLPGEFSCLLFSPLAVSVEESN